MVQAEQRKPKPSRDYLFACYDRLARILEKIAPYERPKLQAITAAEDAFNPPRVKPDLTVLTDEELDWLERIVLKTGGGQAAGADRDDPDRRLLPAARKAADRR